MKNLAAALLLICFFTSLQNLSAQPDPIRKGLDAITNQSVKGQLDFLASDWMEGRNTGTKGIAMAADYITSMFQVYGLKPYKAPLSGGRGFGRTTLQIGEQGFFQDFTMLKTQVSKEHQLSVVTTKDKSTFAQIFNSETDFTFGGRYNPTIGGLSGEAPLVFVGYGMCDEKNGYDEFKGIDVKGKIILRLRGFPGQKDTSSLASKKFRPKSGDWREIYKIESNKNTVALQKGAIAIIEINTSADLTIFGSPKNVFRFFSGDMEFDEYPAEMYNSNFSLLSDSLEKALPYFVVSKRLSNELTGNSGINIEAFEKDVAAKLKPASQELANKSIRFNLKNQIPEIYRGRNVLGVLEGENPNQVVVVGAHYDHKGKYNGVVWNGADDNASGTVAVMTVARACMATGVKPKRTIIFAAWDGEEEGLLGSKYFVKYPVKSDIFANINFDMISRDSDRDTLGVMCGLTYTKAYEVLKTATQKDLETYKIGIKMSYNPQETPSGGSDYNYFAEKKIPVMAYMAAMHKDYHRPGDKPYKVNLTKMSNVIRIGFLNTWMLANVNELK
jgi:hypothetical protein